MSFFKFLVLFLSFSSFMFSKANENLDRNYVAKYAELSHSLATEFGIPYEVIMGVAIIESGSGSSKVARKLNNHFGIVGPNKVRWSRFKQYETVEESFRDFCVKITTKKFYNRLKGNENLKEWIREISKTGYSSHPKRWRAMIYRAISTNHLSNKTT